MKHVNMIQCMSIMLLTSAALTNCAHKPTESVEYVTPIYLNVKPIDTEAKECEPDEIRYYHTRCKIIYQRKDYCVTYFHQVIAKDGSSNIKILCGVPHGSAKVTIEGR